MPYTSVDLSDVSSHVSTFDCGNSPDGVYGSLCSPLFFICSAGQITGFVCQNTLIFNPETGFCDQQEYISSCHGAVHPAHSHFPPLTTANGVLQNTSFIATQASYLENSSKRRCEKGFSGVISKGCSAKFVLCAYGVDHLFICQHNLIYNVETNRCDYAENVDACRGYTTSYVKKSYGPSHFEDTPVSSIRIADLRTIGSLNGAMQMRCLASRNHVISSQRCHKEYITCFNNSTVHKAYCANGFLFDDDAERCVLAKVCGIPNNVNERTNANEVRCSVSDDVPKNTSPCSAPYLAREKYTKTASGISTYMERSLNYKCQEETVVPTNIKMNNTGDFCMDRKDGIYRHPRDCTRILQCFGKEVFEYLPCDYGLVFNEIAGGCDYKRNVPECHNMSLKVENGESSSLLDLDCQGKSHGDILADNEDCSVYYRCVWGKLEKLSCPKQTVFNSILGVCDFPSEVPSCKISLRH
ncbi:unnamed protein product [Thelazia callipaeda]|uniref:Chitin-binding type-2 domain-containing protein n=1 Tax=Thelazia callipaeda TaxID=103827 RepID=A0A0N5D3E4_THECL|nr:unnamed protein product [Thelazia callipaeda]